MWAALERGRPGGGGVCPARLAGESGWGAFSQEAREARAAPAVLPPSARAVRPLGAPGPAARGSGGRAGPVGARLPPGGRGTLPAAERRAVTGHRAARPSPEARPGTRPGRGGDRSPGPPLAPALVGSAVWRVERAGAEGWRWERAVGVDCSAPEPRCLWLPYLGHRDRCVPPGPRRARVSTWGNRGLGLGWTGCPRPCDLGALHSATAVLGVGPD